MTVTTLPTSGTPQVEVLADGQRLLIRDLTIEHPESVNIIRRHEADGGAVAAADLVRRALPVGLVALSMGKAAVDTGAITRTLDVFAERVDTQSKLAITRLDDVITRLEVDEKTVERAAAQILATLPAQLEAALGGEAKNVRSAVIEAARTVQASGAQQLAASLNEHSQTVRNALSLDREGPVRMLRQDLLTELSGTRQELSEHLTGLRAAFEASQAHKQASAKSSRAVGAQWESEALELAEAAVLAAGDLWEATGGQPGAGTTRRTGDGVATLNAAIRGRTEEVRIVIEAKKRSRPLSLNEFRKEVRAGREVRRAAAGIILVPTVEEVPGNGKLCRVDDFGYVVAANDPETVSLVYLIVRELVALLTIKQNDDDEIDLSQVEAKLNLALTALEEFDEVGKLAVQASKHLEKLIVVGRGAQAKARQALSDGLAMLHP